MYKIGYSYKLYCRTIENNIKSDPKTFWQFVDNKKHYNYLPYTIYYDGVEYTESENISNAFAEYFCSAYSTLLQEVNNVKADLTTDILNLTEFSENNVTNALKKIKAKNTMGPDKIPAFILRDCASL